MKDEHIVKWETSGKLILFNNVDRSYCNLQLHMWYGNQNEERDLHH